jgi:hypothetical protein
MTPRRAMVPRTCWTNADINAGWLQRGSTAGTPKNEKLL